jgi:hypothetical protein
MEPKRIVSDKVWKSYPDNAVDYSIVIRARQAETLALTLVLSIC